MKQQQGSSFMLVLLGLSSFSWSSLYLGTVLWAAQPMPIEPAISSLLGFMGGLVIAYGRSVYVAKRPTRN